MSRCAAFLTALCLALPAAAQDVTPAQTGAPLPLQGMARPAAASLAPDIVLVRVAGPWETATDRGFSRLIGRQAGNRLSLVVEWISDGGQTVQSMPLDAPEGSGGLALARMRSETGPADSAVYFDTPDGDTFVLVAGPPGEARFGPASN